MATDTILNFAQNTGQRYANANALNDAQIAKAKQTPVAGVNYSQDLEARDRYLDMTTAGNRGRTDVPLLSSGGDSIYDAQKDLLNTDPSSGGLSIKAGVADKVKVQTERLNAVNS